MNLKWFIFFSTFLMATCSKLLEVSDDKFFMYVREENQTCDWKHWCKWNFFCASKEAEGGRPAGTCVPNGLKYGREFGAYCDCAHPCKVGLSCKLTEERGKRCLPTKTPPDLYCIPEDSVKPKSKGRRKQVQPGRLAGFRSAASRSGSLVHLEAELTGMNLKILLVSLLFVAVDLSMINPYPFRGGRSEGGPCNSSLQCNFRLFCHGKNENDDGYTHICVGSWYFYRKWWDRSPLQHYQARCSSELHCDASQRLSCQKTPKRGMRCLERPQEPVTFP
ncbi:unnamed protein product [Caenorhabditis auriculariae]|uniref:Uncharacterized protein n=1 Tax=Caenorhabditis auriculariae TaxID=2777116 RepID=A0A8S1H0E6_9PELO|nr:unnamed protein product [Caenorhabditis auriculariae]